jgi:hypothetical protein
MAPGKLVSFTVCGSGNLSVFLCMCVLDVIIYFSQLAVELCVLYSVT